MSRGVWVVEYKSSETTPREWAIWGTFGKESDARQECASDPRECRVVRYIPEPAASPAASSGTQKLSGDAQYRAFAEELRTADFSPSLDLDADQVSHEVPQQAASPEKKCPECGGSRSEPRFSIVGGTRKPCPNGWHVGIPTESVAYPAAEQDQERG